MALKDQFENTIIELENLAKGLGNLSNDLINTALEPIEMLLETDDKNIPIYYKSEEEDLVNMISTLKDDIIPLCKESNYSKGEKRSKEIIKLFKKRLGKIKKDS